MRWICGVAGLAVGWGMRALNILLAMAGVGFLAGCATDPRSQTVSTTSTAPAAVYGQSSPDYSPPPPWTDLRYKN